MDLNRNKKLFLNKLSDQFLYVIYWKYRKKTSINMINLWQLMSPIFNTLSRKDYLIFESIFNSNRLISIVWEIKLLPVYTICIELMIINDKKTLEVAVTLQLLIDYSF